MLKTSDPKILPETATELPLTPQYFLTVLITMTPTARKKRRIGTRSKRSEYAVPKSAILSIASTLRSQPPQLQPYSINFKSTLESTSTSTSTGNTPLLWEMTDDILYHIAEYVSLPTARAAFFCRTLAPLCQSAYHKILADDRTSNSLWSLVLSQDYGVQDKKSKPSSRKRSGSSSDLIPERRSCARLQRCPLDQVRDAHRLMRDNSEISYYHVWESSSSTTKNSLTRSKLISILEEFGPNLMYNKVMSTGGNFLVEVCRSRNASCHTVLQCVEELVLRRGCNVDIRTHESSNASLTALCVAAVRGLPKVVEFLLRHGASTTMTCSGRFRLHTNPKKSIRYNDCTPLSFATRMRDAELAEGATKSNLKDLNKCIELLEQHDL